MMEAALRALLTGSAEVSAICPSERVVWGVLGQGSDLPGVVLNVVGGTGSHHYRGPDGLTRYRVQLDAYGNTYTEAKRLAHAIRARLDGHKGGQFLGVFIAAIRDAHETDAADRPYRLSQDFIIMWREP